LRTRFVSRSFQPYTQKSISPNHQKTKKRTRGNQWILPIDPKIRSNYTSLNSCLDSPPLIPALEQICNKRAEETHQNAKKRPGNGDKRTKRQDFAHDLLGPSSNLAALTPDTAADSNLRLPTTNFWVKFLGFIQLRLNGEWGSGVRRRAGYIENSKFRSGGRGRKTLVHGFLVGGRSRCILCADVVCLPS
jgi:hypothetical protein